MATLKGALATGTLSHAYLFVGQQGLGKINAARAVAGELFCTGTGGGARCPACQRLARDAHADFRILEPEGKAAWLMDQIRELNYEATLAAVDAPLKVYVLRAVDQMPAAPANALLKTLEDPPENTLFILLATTLDRVLATIRSRCQILRFTPLSPARSLAALQAKVDVDEARARVALAAAGMIVPVARDYLNNPKQQQARAEVLRVLRDLPQADALDVLELAAAIRKSISAPVEEIKADLAARALQAAETMDTTAIKKLEAYNKRRVSEAELQGITVVLNIIAGLLRDALCHSQGAGHLIDNIDATDLIADIAAIAGAEAIRAGQESVHDARAQLASNVNTQLVLEALLLKLREVLV